MQRTLRVTTAALIALLAPAAAAFQTTRVNLGWNFTQANSDSAFSQGFSADARYVAFISTADNLVAFDTNGVQDVFVRDVVAGTTQRVNVNSSGQQSALQAGASAMSADGRFVAFSSRAADLVAGDANGDDDIFVRDLLLGLTTRVSVDSAGSEGNDHSRSPALSGDGRYVAFASRATNLVANDTNGVWDVFVHDRSTGLTTRVSVDSAGAQGDADAILPTLSGCGRFASFSSAATNLVAGDANLASDVFVHDRLAGVTERISVTPSGGDALLGGQHGFLSADGRCVSFDSGSPDLVAGDTNTLTDVFVRDRWSGVTERVSVGPLGAEAGAISSAGPLSADGRLVTFSSLASNLVAGDTNLKQDAFVHDRAAHTTVRVSVDSAGAEANDSSSGGALSADGRYAVFTSNAANLVANDTNVAPDVFLRDLGPLTPPPPATYCSAGTTSSGCVASISASAQPSVSYAHPCTLAVSGVEGGQYGVLFYGIDNTCYLPTPWGPSSSYLCVRAPLQRMDVQLSGGTPGACDGSLTLDWNAFQLAHPSALGQPWSLGAKVYVQGWFRDPPAPPTSALSNALELVYVP